MRAGPLSNGEVIRLLNAYFVPVYVSNEDYEGLGPAPADERAERNRIWREAALAKLSSGTVHAYVLAPDGHVVDSLHVAEAAKVERTREMLERAVMKFQPQRIDANAATSAAPSAPKATDGGVVLHLVARYLRPQGNELVPLTSDAGLGQTRNASWQAYPAENWIVYDQQDVAKLLPSGDVRVADKWQPDGESLARLLVYFYPSTECNDPRRNRIDQQQLTATVVSIDGGLVRARLDGHLRMKHNFYPGREDQNFVDAPLLGYIDFDSATRQIRTFNLVTDRATYTRHSFGVAVESTFGVR